MVYHAELGNVAAKQMLKELSEIEIVIAYLSIMLLLVLYNDDDSYTWLLHHWLAQCIVQVCCVCHSHALSRVWHTVHCASVLCLS